MSFIKGNCVPGLGPFDQLGFMASVIGVEFGPTRLTASMIASIFFSLPATSFQLAAHFPQKMLCIHVASNELGTLTHDFRQNGFTTTVNGCHLDHFNDAPARIACLALFSPSRLELSRPMSD
jgi:hypothetical protein